jgi:sensor histidine kinase regulating citrate/malate metabolism
MEGAGTITLTILKEGARAVVEVADTGKGIRKKDIGNVFKPVFPHSSNQKYDQIIFSYIKYSKKNKSCN